jgi:hypothetical protein
MVSYDDEKIVKYKNMIFSDGSANTLCNDILGECTAEEPLLGEANDEVLFGLVYVIKLPAVAKYRTFNLKKFNQRQDRYRIFPTPDDVDEIYIGFQITDSEYGEFGLGKKDPKPDDKNLVIWSDEEKSNCKEFVLKYIKLFIKEYEHYTIAKMKFAINDGANKNGEAGVLKIINFDTFPITIRKSKKLYEVKYGAKYIIVGDAAINTNFFTGSGLESGITSGDFVATKIDNDDFETKYKDFIDEKVKNAVYESSTAMNIRKKYKWVDRANPGGQITQGERHQRTRWKITTDCLNKEARESNVTHVKKNYGFDGLGDVDYEVFNKYLGPLEMCKIFTWRDDGDPIEYDY